MSLLLPIFAAIVVVATLLPIIEDEAWWIRIFDFPRIQIVVLGIIVIAAYLILKRPLTSLDRLMLVLVLAAIAIQLIQIRPYTRLAKKQVLDADATDAENSINLLIANVLMSNRNVNGLLQILEESNPDIVLLTEPDKWWQEQLSGIESKYPYTLRCPLENTYGMLFYSKYELYEAEVNFLLEPDVPSMRTIVGLPSGLRVELHCLHPKPPHPEESKDTEERDAELLTVAKEVKGSAHPVIVMGDLNDVAWSHTTRLFQRISGLLDPRIGRGIYNTFHAKYPFIRFPLDHVFHSDHFKLIELERKSYFGSDHFPVHVRLLYQARAENEQDEPDQKSSDKEKAERKIRKGESHEEP
ncbi:MAG: endonuclease/exonuclease/phosphatase family protein [Desulforhabdus sp.]|jgi:endonuclease/exonuclease/phosphatase (EEP) superfamily protein YafD|nr:endonuclease/exonuclease/phosphatase family protein [Desulforhabdus sp.]